MSKIYKIWQGAASWLAGFGADRWLHFIVGVIITFIVGCIAVKVGHGPAWEAGLIALLVAFVAGLAKEMADGMATGVADVTDWLFTFMGGIAGYGLLMLGAWLL